MKRDESNEIIIRDVAEVLRRVEKGHSLANCTLQNLDLRGRIVEWEITEIKHTTFLGCDLDMEDEIALKLKGATIYPKSHGLPYNPYRRELYTWQELAEIPESGGAEPLDLCIYNHFSRSRNNPHISEALSQRIHDHAVDEGIRRLIGFDASGMAKRKCIGIMGGHGTLRTDPYFRKVAHTARLLAKNKFYILTGGGPGIMEAANLGAYFADYSKEELENALAILNEAPSYKDPDWFEQARRVLELYPKGNENLAIPTWFYGHEPSNVFASHIAKYFSNSIREDVLLATSLHGVVFAPGSAGTTQEIFQDATQNHYGTYGWFSPMVFLGKERYELQTLIFPLLKQLSWGKEYHDLLLLTDEPEEVVAFLRKNGPMKMG